MRIAVPSISFCQSETLRRELLDSYPDARFNVALVRLDADDLVEFLADRDAAIMGLEPLTEPMLQSLWAETAPVYREMAREKFQTALPAFQTSSRTEWEALRANLAENAGNKVQAALGRISKRQQRRLAEHFPRLSTKKGTDEIGTVWMETIEKDLEAVLLHFHERYAADLDELAETLEQFRPSQYEGMTEDQLTREFLHLWLMKADRWVMLGDEASPEDER